MNDETALLSQVMHDHGDRWQVQVDPEIGAWSAVERPSPTCLRVIVARDLADLRAKLDKAG